MTPPTRKTSSAPQQQSAHTPPPVPGRDAESASPPHKTFDPEQPVPPKPGVDPARNPQADKTNPDAPVSSPATPNERVDEASKESFPASDPAGSHQSTGAKDVQNTNPDAPSDTTPL